MNCDNARHAMLVAEPSELAGTGGSACAAHIAACPNCAEYAQSILRRAHALRETVVGNDASRVLRTHRVRRREVATLSIAAGIIAVAALGLRLSHESRVDGSAHGPLALNVVIENAQGREVTVLPGADTTVIVFWNGGAP